MKSAKNDWNKARHTLDFLRTSQCRIEIITGCIHVLSALFTLVLTGILIEVFIPSPPIARKFILLGIGIGTTVTIGLTVYHLLYDIRLRKGQEADEWWAFALGRIAPDKLRDRLLNALQINRSRPSARDRFSTGLAKHALYQVVADLDSVTIEQALLKNNRNSSLRTLTFIGLAIILTFVVSSNAATDALGRLIHPTREYQTVLPFTLEISPAGGWVYRGEPIDFIIEAIGSPPKNVEFLYKYDGGSIQSEEVQIRDGRGIVQFDGFSETITYSVRYRKISSSEYRLNVVTRPQIGELQYRLFPPKYSRLPVEVGQENAGNVEALPGSSFELQLRASKPLSASWFIFQENSADSTQQDSLELTVTGNSATVKLDLYTEGRYYIRLQDDKGHVDRDPVIYRIRLLNDDPPSVRIVFPDTDVDMGDEMTLPIRIEADDDFGIARIKLAFRRLGEDTTAQTVPVKLDQPGAPTVLSDHFWDLGELYLMPGDVIEYWAIAWDNDNVSGPKWSESERRLVRLPTLEEIVAGVEQAEQQGLDQAEQTLEAAQDLRNAVNEILEEMRRNPEVDWEKRRQMEDAIERQSDLQKQVEELAKTINELAERLEKNDLATAETLEKYRQLQELIAEIATPELKEAMRKLQEAIENQDPDQIRQALEQFDLDRESFLQSIERSMVILKQLQLERRMDELVKQIEEILHGQEQTLAQMDTANSQQLTDRQNALAKSMEMFENRLQETSDLAEESGEKALSEELDNLAQQIDDKNIPKNMRKVGQNISQGQLNQARSGGEQNARDLAEIASKLSKAANDLKEQRKNELAKKIRRLTEELLYLSQDQEELAEQSKELGTQSPRYRSLAGRQDDIRSALQGVTERLFDVSKETFFITPDLGATLGKASQELDKAIEKYTGRSPRSASTSQLKALGEINKSARQLIDILGQLQNSSSSSGYEEMMERLSEMASSQQGLNQQSMPMPGGQGEQMMPGGQQLARMAAQQRALQQQMEQLAEDGQGMQEILGDLDGIAKAMGEVSDDLEDQNITARTRRLQRQIVSRLLDATRSARQKEYSQKRESKIGKDITRRSPQQLQFDSDKEKLRRDLKRALQEGYTRDYRRLIRAYFQALEEAEKE